MSSAANNENKKQSKATDGDSGESAAPQEGSRRSVVDRRVGANRRDSGSGIKAPESFDRRRGVGRRLSDFTKAAEEGEMTQEQFLFLSAIDAFKRANNMTFPTWTDVLEVVRLLGYRKTQESAVQLPNAEDWQEKPDAPANVRTIESQEAA